MFTMPRLGAIINGVRKLSDSRPQNRVPLIKFIGKRSLLPKRSALAAATVVDKTVSFSTGSGVNFFDLEGGEWFGRPRLTDSEIEAIETGGASVLA